MIQQQNRYYHDGYDEQAIVNDIAILKLSRNVTLGQQIQLACLPSPGSGNTVLNKQTVVTGWGSTTGQNRPAALSNLLQQAQLQVINGNSACNVAGSFFNSANIYCALDSTGSQANVCFGDSGGPLIYFDTASSNRWFIYGVVSFVIAPGGVCANTAPSYFTSVPAYLTWMETTALPFIASGQVQVAFASSSQLMYSSLLIVASVVSTSFRYC